MVAGRGERDGPLVGKQMMITDVGDKGFAYVVIVFRNKYGGHVAGARERRLRIPRGQMQFYSVGSGGVHCFLLRSMASISEDLLGTSLVVQGFRLCLPAQGAQVRSLVWELRFHTPCGQRGET